MTDLFVKLLNVSITASWIVPVVILFRLILKKAPKYINVIMWALVAVRLLVPIDIESPFSLVPNTEPIPQKIVMETESKAEEEPVYSEPVTENESVITDTPIQSESAIIGDTENIGGTVSAPVFEDEPDNAPAPPVADTEASVAETPTVDSQAPVKQRATYKPYVKTAATVWVCGIIAMLICTLISCLRIRKTVSESVCLKGNIRICDRVSSPFIFGLIRPRIYMPSSLKPEDAEYVIAHEMAHIKRGDHFWKPLGFILLTLYWFNPVMWWAYILLCRDIELATDEKAINALGEEYKKPYSNALINCSMPRRMIAACPIAFGEVGVKRRVKTVLNYKKPAFWVVIVAVICCIAVAVTFLTNPKKDNNAVDNDSSTESTEEENNDNELGVQHIDSLSARPLRLYFHGEESDVSDFVNAMKANPIDLEYAKDIRDIFAPQNLSTLIASDYKYRWKEEIDKATNDLCELMGEDIRPLLKDYAEYYFTVTSTKTGAEDHFYNNNSMLGRDCLFGIYDSYANAYRRVMFDLKYWTYLAETANGGTADKALEFVNETELEGVTELVAVYRGLQVVESHLSPSYTKKDGREFAERMTEELSILSEEDFLQALNVKAEDIIDAIEDIIDAVNPYVDEDETSIELAKEYYEYYSETAKKLQEIYLIMSNKGYISAEDGENAYRRFMLECVTTLEYWEYIFVTENEVEPEPAPTDEELEKRLVGSWYGTDFDNFGITYKFNADGTGVKSYFDSIKAAFQWKAENGSVTFEYSNPAEEIGEEALNDFNSKDFSFDSYSQTKPYYGNDSRLDIGSAWLTEDESISLTFYKSGDGKGSIDDEDIVFKWKSFNINDSSKGSYCLFIIIDDKRVIKLSPYSVVTRESLSFTYEGEELTLVPLYKIGVAHGENSQNVLNGFVCSVNYISDRDFYNSSISSVSGGVTLHRIDSEEMLEEFRRKYDPDNTEFNNHFDNAPSFNEIVAGYGDGLFDNYSLFIASVTCSSSETFALDSVYLSDNDKTLNIQIMPTNFFHLTNADMINQFIVVPVRKVYFEGCTHFAAQYKTFTVFEPNFDYSGYELHKSSYNGTPESIAFALPLPFSCRLIGFEIKGGIAYLDFNDGFDYEGDSYVEKSARKKGIWSIVKTFTAHYGSQGVRGVFITVNGEHTKDENGNLMNYPLGLDENGLVTVLYPSAPEALTTYKSGFSYAGYTDGLDSGAIFRIDSLASLDAFKLEHDELFDFDAIYEQKYVRPYNFIPSFNTVAEAYNEAFFESYYLFVIYIQSNNSARFEFVEAGYSTDGKTLNLSVGYLSDSGKNGSINSGCFITVGILKTAARDYTNYNVKIKEKFTVYTHENLARLVCREVYIDTFDDTLDRINSIIDVMIIDGTLPKGTHANSFFIEDSMGHRIGHIDMNSSFAEGLSTGALTEHYGVGSLVNTLISNFRTEKILITVDGKPLNLEHMGEIRIPFERFDTY